MSGLDLAGLGYDAQRAATVRLLAAGDRLTTVELAYDLGVSPSRAGDILRELHEDGHIARDGRPFRYFVPGADR